MRWVIQWGYWYKAKVGTVSTYPRGRTQQHGEWVLVFVPPDRIPEELEQIDQFQTEEDANCALISGLFSGSAREGSKILSTEELEREHLCEERLRGLVVRKARTDCEKR